MHPNLILRFLVDVNPPKHFYYFKTNDFIHVVDIDPEWTDKEIWEYAIKNNLIILTKDTDFYNRFVTSTISPKIVYLKIGNLTLKELHDFFENNWGYIKEMLSTSKFIVVPKSEIRKIQ